MVKLNRFFSKVKVVIIYGYINVFKKGKSYSVRLIALLHGDCANFNISLLNCSCLW